MSQSQSSQETKNVTIQGLTQLNPDWDQLCELFEQIVDLRDIEGQHYIYSNNKTLKKIKKEKLETLYQIFWNRRPKHDDTNNFDVHLVFTLIQEGKQICRTKNINLLPWTHQEFVCLDKFYPIVLRLWFESSALGERDTSNPNINKNLGQLWTSCYNY